MKITDALVAEHTIFLGVFDHIERVLPKLTTLTEAQTLASVVEGLLESHAGTETNLAYLALDHILADKGQLDHLHQEHQELDDRFRQVHTAGNCTEAARLLRSALLASRQHFSYEERSVFPLLETALKPETLLILGHAWLRRLSAPNPVSQPA